MSTNRTRAIALTGWSDAPPLQLQLAIGIRELVEDVRRRAKRPRRTGGQKGPPGSPRREAYWDDPALWLLMMH